MEKQNWNLMWILGDCILRGDTILKKLIKPIVVPGVFIGTKPPEFWGQNRGRSKKLEEEEEEVADIDCLLEESLKEKK